MKFLKTYEIINEIIDLFPRHSYVIFLNKNGIILLKIRTRTKTNRNILYCSTNIILDNKYKIQANKTKDRIIKFKDNKYYVSSIESKLLWQGNYEDDGLKKYEQFTKMLKYNIL